MDPLRILIADDHQAILDRLCSQLADEFEVVGAVLDGQAAFDAAVTLRPGAVVLDISMPRLSGLGVARRLSALPNPPRIVFLTVHDDQDFRDAATEAGASGYVLKRQMCTHLVAALRHALQA